MKTSKILRTKLFLVFLVTALAVANAAPVFAAAGFDADGFKPATDQGYYLTVEQTQTLGQWGYAVGLLHEFSNDSVIARLGNGTKLNDVVNGQLVTHFGAALGLLDWLNAGLLVDFAPLQNFNAVGTNVPDHGSRMGDIRFHLKGRLLDSEKHPLGIALIPFVTFPTGNEAHFLGNGKVTGGGVLAIDTPRLFGKFSAALNVGAQIRSSAALTTGTTVGDQFLVGAGVNYALHPKVQLIYELNGWTFFDHFMEKNNRNLEGHGALRWLATDHWAVTAGAGTGFLDGIGAPDYRVFASVAYRHPSTGEVREEVIRTNQIHFEFDRADIKKSSYPVLDNIVATIRNRNDISNIRVEGHTDSLGSDAYNDALSARRAASVSGYLTGHGVAKERVTSVGKGEREPIAPNQINGRDNPAGRAQNRRVEFHLSLKPGARVKVVEDKNSGDVL
jgi:outer membrane protein OmpA-like peptidoglycan-associated protein